MKELSAKLMRCIREHIENSKPFKSKYDDRHGAIGQWQNTDAVDYPPPASRSRIAVSTSTYCHCSLRNSGWRQPVIHGLLRSV